MTGTLPQTEQPARAPRRPRVTRVLLVVVLGVHAVVSGLQPVFAGAYLSGSLDAMVTHGMLASLLVVVTAVQLVVAVLFWRPCGGPGWPAAATLALLLAEVVQFGVGYVRMLAVHVPLGVAVVAAAVAMFWWSLVWRPLP